MIGDEMTWADLRKKIPPLPRRVVAHGQIVLSATEDDGRTRRFVTMLMRTLDESALRTEAETFHSLMSLCAANDNSPDDSAGE